MLRIAINDLFCNVGELRDFDDGSIKLHKHLMDGLAIYIKPRYIYTYIQQIYFTMALGESCKIFNAEDTLLNASKRRFR